MELTLHQLEPSPFCDKVRRVLRYKRVPFVLVDHPITALRQVSPRTGKLPVLEAGDVVIDDSTQVALWLEEQFPERPLLPSAPEQRALCLALEDWADESLYHYEIALHFLSPDNARARTETLVELEAPVVRGALRRAMAPFMRWFLRQQGTGRRSRATVLQDIARHFEIVAGLSAGGGWLVGDRISLADIAVFAQLDLIVATPEGGDIAARLPGVERWCERVRDATGGRFSGSTSAGSARRRGRVSIAAGG